MFDSFLKVPTAFSFDEVFDMYFKLHHVLNIQYHPNLKNLLIFMEHFVYGMKESFVPVNMTKLAKKIIKD